MATSKNHELAQLASTLVVNDSGTITDLNIDTSNIDSLVNIDLAIAPEILEIQVAAPAAGQDTAWLWTWEQSTLPYARRTITNSPEVSVPLYKQGTYTINNYAAYDLFGSMTQTHTLYIKWIDGAGTDNLVSWVTSSGPISDSHPDINSGNATDVQRLSVNVPATITLPTLTAPSVSYTVTNNGSGAYTFSGSASGDNPNIGPLYRGGTYTFNVSATGHPLYFTTDNGTNFSAGTYFGEYTDGVTGSRTDSGTVTIVVPSDAPNTLYYQCGNHSPMRGAITIKDLAVETNINGNYVIYAQHTQEGHKTPIELRPIPSLVNQMCLVYDSTSGKFVPQDLATYVENTPSFENKIREVAGTAELVVEDGSTVIAKVNVYDDSTYLPLTGNNPGDQAFATDTNILYIWDGSAWQQAGTTNSDDLTEGSTNLFYTEARVNANIAGKTTDDLTEGTNLYYTDERVDDRVSALVVGGNNITATYDDAAGTLTLDGQPGYTDTDVGNYLSANGYDTATNIVASITDSAPATLDTLNELAAALGDDPNFATTTTNLIATKLAIADFTTTLNTNSISELSDVDTTSVAPTDGQFLVWDNANSKWEPGDVPLNNSFDRFVYTVSSDTSLINGNDDNGNPLSYVTTGNEILEVYVNGVKQVGGNDYTATTGTSISFNYTIGTGSVVEVIYWEAYIISNTSYYTKAQSDALYYTQAEVDSTVANYLPIGGGTITGNLTVSRSGDSGITILADSNNDGTNNWPYIDFRIDNTTGIAQSRIAYKENLSGLSLEVDGGSDFFIKSGGRVGIGNTDPSVPLHITTTSNEPLRLDASDGQQTSIGFAQNNDVKFLIGNDLYANGGKNFFIYDEDQATTRILVDGGSGAVGIGTTTPSAVLDVNGDNTDHSTWTARFVGANNSKNGLLIQAGANSNQRPLRIQTHDGNTTILTATAENRVGIHGVDNPSTSLDVGGAQNKTSLHLRSGDINTASGGGNQITFGFDNSTNYRHSIKTRHDSANVSNNLFDFYVWQPSQNAADNGNRHVARFEGTGATFPANPAFEATITTQTNVNLTGGNEHKLQFNSCPQNRTSSYNTSNYRFTAPVAGFYHFSVCAQINNIDNTSWAWNLQLRRNGTHKAGVYTGTSSVGYEGGTTAATLYLNVGDYVEAWMRANTSFIMEYGAADGRWQFSGFLVG